MKTKYLYKFRKKLWRQINRRTYKVILALLLIGAIARLIPYLAPIRATDIAQTQFAFEFTDRHGFPLGTLLTRDQEHTAITPLEQVSPHFRNAIIAAEDGNFYHHGALDVKAIARAMRDALQAKKIISGASTITMQLARMLDPLPRTLSGKIHEIWQSWRLAAGMSKDEILSAYVNRLPMGGNLYGVEAAARTYFSVSASELNLAQASLLAAIPNNPTYFDPLQHYPRLKQRQKYVLNQMVQDGYIGRSQAEQAYAENVTFQSRQRGIIAAPHFLFWLAAQTTSSQGWVSPIRTTIDRPLQQFVEAQVQQVTSSLATNNVHHAAALVIDNHAGEVLAYVGSPNYFDEAKLGRNDGVQALRQPGSTLKPFLYELALEKDAIRPNTILADVPTHYAIPGAKLYSPTDYSQSFQGPVRVRVALANSLNIPAVRVLEKVGVQAFLDRLHELGFEHLNQSAEYYGLGLTLGSGEVSLWELARAYVFMARQGAASALVTTFEQPEVPSLKIKQQVNPMWQLLTNMLSDRHARATAFGVDSVLNLPFATAVKTGTSSNFRDTWTVGFTTDYTVATWVGNFDGEPMRHVSGVMGAAPLWHRIMLHLHEHQEPTDFPDPEGMVELPICANSGLQPTPNCQAIVQEFFTKEYLKDYKTQNDFALSSDYNEWLARQQHSEFTSNTLRIVSPHNGDVFLLSPGEEGKQKLEFKLVGTPALPIEWQINGEKLNSYSSNSVFWSLQPGEWTLEVRSGSIIDQVSFRVELAKMKPTRRGFSIATSSES